jgi:hypothetical protein
MKSSLLGVGLLALASTALGGCNACEKLEEKICGDLGADDCAIWKEADGPKSLYGGRRENRACTNMLAGPAYDGMLKGAQAVVEVQKKLKNKKKP